MYFGLSEDQIFFQDNVKKFLEDQAPLDAIKKISEGEDLSVKDELHQGLISLGINNILIPEENGGLGLDLLFASAVSQSLGEGIATLPFLGPYVVAPIAIKYGASDKQKEKLFNEISQNLICFGIGFSEYFGSRDSSGLSIENNTVTGRTLFVLDTDYASHVMLCDKEGKIGFVSLDSKGVEIIDLTTVDKTRTYKEMRFENTPIEILENTKSSSIAIEMALNAGRIIIAADSLGASQEMINRAVEYSKERKQFNRVIGSFQAVKHMCAEMSAELEPCYSLLWHAAHSFDESSEDTKLMACLAKSHISEVSKMVSKKATEVHGGMGFTDLLGLHFWFKRIGLNRHILGSPEIVREDAAKAQGL
ncbi:MAG: acyl-CoA dehydrogenase [Gammaproteobacteria bacterium]|nr:acyl-CoA dehydrogenase [Gammaproteobacteria bacterium]|tara:strand:+ start:3171 stop:4259 length:1089 start_codon:yes stop_codon:yes gene_type:complete